MSKLLLSLLLVPLTLSAQTSQPQALVTSAATGEPGLPLPGGLAAVYMTGIPISGLTQASPPLPPTLGGISVDVCGTPAPILAVAGLSTYSQVNFQVPDLLVNTSRDTAGNTVCTVTVQQGDVVVSYDAVVRQNVAADLFFSPDNLGVMIHGATGKPVTREAPALPGEAIVLYASAISGTYPHVAAGDPAPWAPFATFNPTQGAALWREIYLLVDPEQDPRSVYNPQGPSAPHPAPAPGPKLQPIFIGLVPGLVGVVQIQFYLSLSSVAQNPDVFWTPGDHVFQFELGECHAFHGGGCQSATGWTYSNPVIVPVGATQQFSPVQ